MEYLLRGFQQVLHGAAYLFLIVEVFLLVFEVIQYCRSRKNPIIEMETKPLKCSLWNTAIFFPDDINSSSRNQLFWYLGQATESIKICMHLIDFPTIGKIIEEGIRKGVKVQIITLPSSAKRLDLLRGYNLIKIHQTKVFYSLMHHKFTIIDDEAVLTGSLNWTQKGFRGNRENVLITTNSRAVKDYIAEFDNLWRNSYLFRPFRKRSNTTTYIDGRI